nr:hypothetical protein [Sulfurivirga caldicuralii]
MFFQHFTGDAHTVQVRQQLSQLMLLGHGQQHLGGRQLEQGNAALRRIVLQQPLDAGFVVFAGNNDRQTQVFGQLAQNFPDFNLCTGAGRRNASACAKIQRLP